MTNNKPFTKADIHSIIKLSNCLATNKSKLLKTYMNTQLDKLMYGKQPSALNLFAIKVAILINL